MNSSPLNILIAEDDPGHVAAIRRILEKEYPDAIISLVTSICDYREHIAASVPSITILDLNLSDGRTFDLLTAPAGDGPFPIIMMTSNGSEQVAADAIKRGALDYMVKSPDTFATIAAAVAGALREWELLQGKKRMEMQLKESQALIIQQEKMASIGQLAAGVAHEINNPMGYITSNLNSLGRYAEKLAQFLELQEKTLENCTDLETRSAVTEQKRQLKMDFVLKDLRELIAESLEGATRVSKIVRDLKSFSRAEGDEAVLSDLNDYIRSTVNVVRNEIKYVAQLDLQLGEIPPVICRPQQISQVVMNLLVNAAHAIVDKGVITLRTEQVDGWVEISVTDTGSGIAPELMEKIFEPFFTTKVAGKGTGLGLAISLDIVRKHGGELLVSSERGTGTTFTVRLPLEGKEHK